MINPIQGEYYLITADCPWKGLIARAERSEFGSSIHFNLIGNEHVTLGNNNYRVATNAELGAIIRDNDLYVEIP